MTAAPPVLPWYRRWWFYLLILAVGGVLALVITSEVRDWQVRRDLAAFVAELDQTDPNWQLENWYQSQPQLADGENLTLVALKWQEQFKNEGPRFQALFQKEELYTGQPLNAEQAKALSEVVGSSDARQDLRKLLRLKTGVFPAPDVTRLSYKSLTVSLNAQQNLRRVATLLGYQAEFGAHERRADDALEACHGILHLSHCFDHDPHLISQLTAMALHGHSVTILERVLSQVRPSLAALTALQEAYLQEAGHSLAQAVLRGDRAGMDHLLLEVEQGRYTRDELRQMLGMRGARGSLNFLSVDDLWTRFREWTKSSPFGYIPRERLEALQFYQELRQVEQQVPEWEATGAVEAVRRKYQTKSAPVLIFGAGISKVLEADRKRRMMLSTAAALLAAERYRLDTGKRATGWNDIVPKYYLVVPKDPFDGQPLRWKNTETGFVIYAVWLNRVDDGGLIHATETAGPKDCGLEYWDVKHRGKLPPRPLPKTEDE